MTRLSCNITDETAADLREMAARRGCTVTEVIRRSVEVYNFLATEQDKGRRIRLVDHDGCQYVQVIA